MNSTGRPSSPPASFSALTATCAPRNPGVSSGACTPVRQSAPPNTIGSSWAATGAADSTAASTAAIAAFDMSICSLPLDLVSIPVKTLAEAG